MDLICNIKLNKILISILVDSWHEPLLQVLINSRFRPIHPLYESKFSQNKVGPSSSPPILLFDVVFDEVSENMLSKKMKPYSINFVNFKMLGLFICFGLNLCYNK
jgi:hypothetical protein